jgi:hypothetical protein
MKNIILCLSLAAGFLGTSCLEKPAEKEVVLVPVPAPAPAATATPAHIIIEKEKPWLKKKKRTAPLSPWMKTALN